jgi:starch synthase
MSDRNKRLKILMAAAECAPYAKVGGLADVVGSLPSALSKQGIDVRVIMPLYGVIDKEKYDLKKIYSGLEVPSGRILMKVNIYEGIIPSSNVKIFFLDSPEYFSQKHIYGKGDNSERFLFFSLAALYAIPVLNFEPNILHMHDAHVAMMADVIKTSNLEYIRDLKTVYTIHNFYYQYKEDEMVLSTGNLHPKMLKSLAVDLEDGDVNFMAQGILNSDIITTVSPTYAEEILTSAYGAGLEKVIRKRKDDLYGIINGIDTDLFNPEEDQNIVKNYSVRSIKYKKDNKIALQKEFGLSINGELPVIGLISRLVWQKGLELITDKLRNLKAQFVFLGRGTARYENHLNDLAKKHPDQFATNIGFDLKLAQMIYAGSDFFLMPSRFEPCGLGQLIAMRYGTVPIVRETGGLKDTVPSELGFSFKNVDEKELFECIKTALDVYYEKAGRFRENAEKGNGTRFFLEHAGTRVY